MVGESMGFLRKSLITTIGYSTKRTDGVDEEGTVEAKQRIAVRFFEEVGGMNPQTVLDLLGYWKIAYAHLYPAFLIVDYQKALAENIYPCIDYETGELNKKHPSG